MSLNKFVFNLERSNTPTKFYFWCVKSLFQTLYSFFYTISVFFMQLGFRLAAFFHPKARLWIEGRKQLWRQLEHYQPSPQTAWFHCASVGEFEQARPVLETFRKENPDWKIVLTFFSPSGYELRKNYNQADLVCYLPLDTAKNARQFVDIIQPKMAFWVKYEFWYHHLHELKKRNVPVLLFSAIFRPDQIFFKSYGGFYRTILKCFSHLFVQNEESLKLLKSISITNVSLSGDTRFDRVVEIAREAKSFPVVEQFCGEAKVLVGGSVWPEDWKTIAYCINEYVGKHKLKCIIAPHEIDIQQIEQWSNEVSVKSVRYSQATTEAVQQADLLWIDNIGMLASLYRYGHFAFVGGAYKNGLHNIVEAAVWGMPLFFGDKKYRKFQEAHDLLALGSAHAVADGTEFTRIFTNILQQPDLYQHEAKTSRAYVYSKIGATEQIMRSLKV